MDPKGKVAFVTGGASGIGESITRSLLANGVSVSFFDVKKTKGEELKTSLEAEYGKGKVQFTCGDATKKEELEGAIKTTIDTFSRLDILVNNAGFESEDKWDEVIDLNLKAVVRGTYAASKYMSKDKGGRGGVIVNIASILGLEPYPTGSVYSATKYAVIGFTKSHGFPEEHEETGIRYVAVCPGVTFSALLGGDAGDKLRRYLARYNMPYQPQKPEVVADSVVEAIRGAPNGSIWVVEYGGPAYQVDIPNFRTFKVGGD